ncbi:hypothetical protein ALC56_00135 [Trachymyrmex septentrionalis]|uniref:Uncharacterized protein n=1 Tax=Trachymyrmex septentrionalis TaxID=34720 RepID=A0A195FYD5_9HYME|nr:hypothetical protein ALC56_00135 [Trachymyrmex septentrionalis]
MKEAEREREEGKGNEDEEAREDRRREKRRDERATRFVGHINDSTRPDRSFLVMDYKDSRDKSSKSACSSCVSLLTMTTTTTIGTMWIASMLLTKLSSAKGNEKTKKERKKERRRRGKKESTGKGEEVLTEGIGLFLYSLALQGWFIDRPRTDTGGLRILQCGSRWDSFFL